MSVLEPTLAHARTGVTLAFDGAGTSLENQTITEGQVAGFEYTISKFFNFTNHGSEIHAFLSPRAGSDHTDTQAQVLLGFPNLNSCQSFDSGGFFGVGTSCFFFISVGTSLAPGEADADFGVSTLVIQTAYTPLSPPSSPVPLDNFSVTLTVEDPTVITSEPATFATFVTGMFAVVGFLRHKSRT